MTYIKISNELYPATIISRPRDTEWNDRASMTITLTMAITDALALFTDDVAWSIVEDVTDNDEPEQIEYDNSEYCVAGDITDHRDGTVSVKMGKLTAGEILAIITGGAI